MTQSVIDPWSQVETIQACAWRSLGTEIVHVGLLLRGYHITTDIRMLHIVRSWHIYFMVYHSITYHYIYIYNHTSNSRLFLPFTDGMCSLHQSWGFIYYQEDCHVSIYVTICMAHRLRYRFQYGYYTPNCWWLYDHSVPWSNLHSLFYPYSLFSAVIPMPKTWKRWKPRKYGERRVTYIDIGLL